MAVWKLCALFRSHTVLGRVRGNKGMNFLGLARGFEDLFLWEYRLLAVRSVEAQTLEPNTHPVTDAWSAGVLLG